MRSVGQCCLETLTRSGQSRLVSLTSVSWCARLQASGEKQDRSSRFWGKQEGLCVRNSKKRGLLG